MKSLTNSSRIDIPNLCLCVFICNS